ncbi:hypothetical protein KW797_03045 [Candidatus Parcubacteria bacterium]|nr:hypothetical protein [Candidatus Parcubacteria bacterium]
MPIYRDFDGSVIPADKISVPQDIFVPDPKSPLEDKPLILRKRYFAFCNKGCGVLHGYLDFDREYFGFHAERNSPLECEVCPSPEA